jgi:hypothetical protein
MPNGRPGDHPHYDIVHHKIDLLGGGLDDKVRKLSALASSDLNQVVGHLVYCWPWDDREIASPHGLSSVLDALLWYAEKRRSKSAD